MGSNLNPDSDFLTNMPVGFIEPLDPSILTNPPWFDVFLTPGASFATRIARDTATSPVGVTPTSTSAPVVTLSPTGIISITNTPVPTNTVIYIPPPNTSTPKPPPPPPPDTAVPTNTNTSVPAVLVDLQITKTDGVAAYTAGGLVTYSIVVTNPTGPGNVVGAIVSDSFPAQIASATWTCVAAGGASCTANGSGNINDTVNVPAGGSLTYTVTANISASATGNMTNTAAVAVPAGYTDTNSGNNSASDTDTPAFSANLGITKTDNVGVYMAGNALRYTIVVSNAGPSSVIGATVTDTFSSNLDPSTITWTCAGTGGASCTGAGTGNINDAAVNLPFGSSVTYTVNATVVASPSGDLVNTATVSSSITDPNPGNNSATDTDVLLSSVGTTPDGTVFVLSANGFLTLNLNTAANGDPGVPDLVYYEQPEGSGVLLDWVIVQVGDGTSWFTVFNWGDEVRDTNTNMDYAGLTLPPPVGPPPNEPDQRDILSTDLFMSTGIAIDLDSVVPAGNYLYVRFLAPAGAGDVQIDAVQSLP